ncbi:MAG: hypothetical protein WD396_04685 [Pseudohongiellaceae bacterium]
MSENKHADNDPKRTLVTLEQLSQTIEVMTSVVNRLRQHLSEQLKEKADAELATELSAQGATEKVMEQVMEQVMEKAQEDTQTGIVADTAVASAQKKESFVVEIRQQEDIPVPKNGKNLH